MAEKTASFAYKYKETEKSVVSVNLNIDFMRTYCFPVLLSGRIRWQTIDWLNRSHLLSNCMQSIHSHFFVSSSVFRFNFELPLKSYLFSVWHLANYTFYRHHHHHRRRSTKIAFALVCSFRHAITVNTFLNSLQMQSLETNANLANGLLLLCFEQNENR